MKTNVRYFTCFLLFFLVFIIQTTMLKHIAILGYSPNILLCLVVVSSFLYDEKVGLVYGLIFGVLLDLTTGTIVGPSSVGFALVYVFVIIMRRIFSHERLLPEFLLAVVSTPLYVFTVWGLCKIGGAPIGVMLVVKALPVLIVYNCVFIVIFHLILVRGVIKHRRDAKITGKYELHNGLKI